MKINDTIENIKINKLVNEGLALNYINNKTVLISNAIPGDIATIKLIKKKKKIFFAKVIKIEKKSEFRIKSNCIHSEICGGCIYQDIAYTNQIKFKEDILNNTISYNLPFLENITSPIVCSTTQEYYRNKMEFAFSRKESNIVIGLKEKNTFDQVFKVTNCKLMSKESNKFLEFACDYFSKTNLPIWNSRDQTGCLSHFVIRHSKAFDEYMINLKAHTNEELFNDFATKIASKFKKISSVNLLLIHEKKGTPTSIKCIKLLGNSTIKEKIGNLTFKISPLSFFQTNSNQTKVLYDIIKELININENTKLLDLYCGTGTIGLYSSNNNGQLIGIEEIEEAIENAKNNAILNNIKNTTFFSGRVKNILKFNTFDCDTVIVDPPRSGMNPKALKRTAELKCNQIIYVSCNPNTLIRDLKEFMNFNYKIKTIIPVDMFPQTYHLECVVKLTLH